MPITDIASLRAHLQWAVEIEHGTLPPYMCALYSIREGKNPEAIEVIQSVFMEEMLHLTLAANILNAVGGSPQLDAPRVLPRYPTHLPHSNHVFEVSLMKFCPQALSVFMQIEKPAAHDGLPQDDSFVTIGQFYEALGEGLRRLNDEIGEETLFCGDPARQITNALYYGGAGRVIAVLDLQSALHGLEEIVEQGEGMQHELVWDGDQEMFHPEREEVAHYFRFQELSLGRRYQMGDTPQSGPSGASFSVDWDAVHDMRVNPRSEDYPPGSEVRRAMDEFNRSYCGVLHLLEECFNGNPSLLALATGAMYGLKAQAIVLMQMSTPDGKGRAGPSFEYIAREVRQHRAGSGAQIVVIANGPYLVHGDVPLVRKRKILSEDGNVLTWHKPDVIETEATYALCRCGHSSSKPFCDGTHARIGFNGDETADPRPTADRQRVLEGHGVVVRRDGPLCMHAAFCIARTRRIPEIMADTDDSDVRAQVMAMIDRCPSGSYTYALAHGEPDVEPDLPISIAVTEEEDGLAGALWVTGGIPIHRSDGERFETRNRVTLCRCGQSRIKPLCDGTHRQVQFRERPDAK